jgi:hypothetical protein
VGERVARRRRAVRFQVMVGLEDCGSWSDDGICKSEQMKMLAEREKSMVEKNCGYNSESTSK